MTDKKNTMQEILGIVPNTPTQTAAQIFGGILFGGGLYGAIRENDRLKSFTGATKDIQLDVAKIPLISDARATEAKAGLEADISGYTSKTEAGIQQGLRNRGITNQNVSESSVGGLKAGLSGAYANARLALARAKLNAGTALSGALATYNMDVAKKQYESLVSRYYGKMGIWGALGGLGGSMLDDKEATPDINPINTQDTIDSIGSIDQTPFILKGVTDSKGFRMKGVK